MGRGMKRAPVRETCPDIDKVIDAMNDLRTSNAALRQWGGEEADRVDELEAELEEARDTIADLTSDIESLQAELKELQTSAA